jgi:hypothetical protein
MPQNAETQMEVRYSLLSTSYQVFTSRIISALVIDLELSPGMVKMSTTAGKGRGHLLSDSIQSLDNSLNTLKYTISIKAEAARCCLQYL